MSTALFFYHGTSLENAKKLMTMEIPVMEVPAQAVLDYAEYTDFGKGFYTHPHESKHLAFEWAKRNHAQWGVVRFALSKNDLDKVTGSALHFSNKKSRPANAPQLPGAAQPANWLEFVEYNRHIGMSALRPKDNDWTPRYAWMRGPLWVPRDSGIKKGHPPFADHVHQIDWGVEGLKLINSDGAKKLRFLFTKDNEHEQARRPCFYLVPGTIQALKQPTGSVCWATAYAIMRSWKDRCSYSIRDAAAGVDEKYAVMVDKDEGLPPTEFTPFLHAAGLQHDPMWNLPVEGWLKLLKDHGLLWVGTLAALPPGSPLHSRIVEGMSGSGDSNGAWMKIVDPGNGSRYNESFRTFLAKYEGAFIQSQSGTSGFSEYYQIRYFR